MQVAKALFAGALGALMITILTAIARVLGMQINIEMMLGSMLSGALDAGSWLLGFVMHVIIGGVFGLIYAALFEYSLGRAGGGPGLAIGAVHAVIAGLLLGVIPTIHPMMPEWLSVPGFFFGSLGLLGVVTFVVLHLLFGALVGTLYRPVKLYHRRLASGTSP